MLSPGYGVMMSILSTILNKIKIELQEQSSNVGVITGGNLFKSYELKKYNVPQTKSKHFTLTLYDVNQVSYIIVFRSISLMNAHNFFINIEQIEEESTSKDFYKLQTGNDNLKLLNEIYELILQRKMVTLLSCLDVT